MFRYIALLGIAFLSTQAMALSDEACEQLLTQAEENKNHAIYDDCGFGDETKAWNTWAPFAAAHDMKQALFELCRRYPTHAYGEMYCDKAINLNYGPALAYKGRQLLDQDQTAEAMDYFNRAVKSGDLDESETLKLMETLGFLYLKEKTPYYAPRSGVALLAKAANQRSAVANNALGYLVYSGQNGVKKDPKKALEFIWRAILYGCSAAEENLGVFHLARQGKISEDEATYYMSLQAFTCQPFDKNFQSDPSVTNCNCADVRSQEAYFQSKPYLYLTFKDGPAALIRNHNGEEQTIREKDELSGGLIVEEIRPTLITLKQGSQKVFINRYHSGRCVESCLKNEENKPRRRPVAVRPYHLTFTKRECADIAYYANRLIDTTRPYVGKTECQGADMDETTKLLLGTK